MAGGWDSVACLGRLFYVLHPTSKQRCQPQTIPGKKVFWGHQCRQVDAGFRARETEGDNSQVLIKRGQPGSDASLCSDPNPTNTSITRSVTKKELKTKTRKG